MQMFKDFSILLLFFLSPVVILLMSSWCVQGLRVNVFPRKPLFKLGTLQQVVCQVQDCSAVPDISWFTVNDRPLLASTATNRTHSVLTFNSVTIQDEGQMACKVTCAGQRAEIRTSVSVYCEFIDQEIIILVSFHAMNLKSPSSSGFSLSFRPCNHRS